MPTASVRGRLRDLLAPVVEGAGLDLEDVEVTPAGRRRVLRVVVDRDGGVSLDDIATVSATVAGALDGSDAMGGAPYVLEVTSPGVDRPLTQPRHWRRNAGRLVTATLAQGDQLTGRLLSAADDGVELDVDGTVSAVRWSELTRGVVQVEFNRPRDSAPDTGPTPGRDEEVPQWTST